MNSPQPELTLIDVGVPIGRCLLEPSNTGKHGAAEGDGHWHVRRILAGKEFRADCLNADKMRLIEFGQYAERNRKQRGERKPETFIFLGFTHYCGKRRSDGTFMVSSETAKKRMVAKLHSLKAELVRRKHDPSAQIGEWLKKVVQGYYQYHAVPGNMKRLRTSVHRLRRMWRAILGRRSQCAKMCWQRINPLLDRWIPFRRVLHPYPQLRFAARHPS